MHVKILAKGGFLEDTGSGGNGEGGLHVRALPPRRPPPQEPAKDRDDAGRSGLLHHGAEVHLVGNVGKASVVGRLMEAVVVQ